jgi:aspartate aminotransferase
VTPKTKAIILNSPSNPTGALISEATVAAIAEAAATKGIWIIVDLCYEQLIYEDVPHNLPKVLFDRHRDRTILACSGSKAYAMTGWRAGWTIAPAVVTKAFNTIQGQSTSNITTITQKAMLAGLTGSHEPVKAMLHEFRQRRDSMHAWLTANPAIKCVKPSGAFYLFPNVTDLLTPEVATSLDFAAGLLEQEKVVVTPGEAFDAPGYLRISYATSMEQLREGATRMLRYAESIQPKASATR